MDTQLKLDKKIKDARSRKFMKAVVKYKALLIMMIPCSIILFINSYLPLFGLIIAFKNINYKDGIFRSPWSGLENFRFLFSTDAAWRITRNTIAYNLVFIFVGMVISVAIAIALNEIRNRYLKKCYQTLVILPNFLSMVVVAYIVYSFLNPEQGYMNTTILKKMNITPIKWYDEPIYWPYILILTKLWHSVGYGSIIYIATLTGIDSQLYEAAIIDGASKWQQTKYITIPSLSGMMIISIVLALGNIIKGDFGLFFQVPMSSGLLYGVTDVVDTYVYRALITLQDIGMASAAGFYQSVVGLIMVVIANLIVRKIDKEQALF